MVSSCVYDNAETNAQKRSIHEGPKPNLFQYWAHRGLILLLPTKKLHTLSPLFKKWANPGLFLFILVFFTLQFQHKLKKAKVVCLGFEPAAAGW